MHELTDSRRTSTTSVVAEGKPFVAYVISTGSIKPRRYVIYIQQIN